MVLRFDRWKIFERVESSAFLLCHDSRKSRQCHSHRARRKLDLVVSFTPAFDKPSEEVRVRNVIFIAFVFRRIQASDLLEPFLFQYHAAK